MWGGALTVGGRVLDEHLVFQLGKAEAGISDLTDSE
jgi:hypothetical protein